MADHIHTPGDGRGRRDVFLDGKRLTHCIYADTKRGIIDVHVLDDRGYTKLDKRRKRPLTKRYRGKVEVVPCE